MNGVYKQLRVLKITQIVMTKQYLINESELMKDWDFDENQDLNLAVLLVGSNKKAAWICYLCGSIFWIFYHHFLYTLPS